MRKAHALQDAYANRNERPFFQRVAKSCSVNHRGRGYRQLISTLERSSFRLVISPMSDLLSVAKIRFRMHFFLPLSLCSQRKWRQLSIYRAQRESRKPHIHAARDGVHLTGRVRATVQIKDACSRPLRQHRRVRSPTGLMLEEPET